MKQLGKRTIGPPCGHSKPQADSQLHGVCVFCYRDRLHQAVTQRDEALEALEKCEEWVSKTPDGWEMQKVCMAAIAKAKGGTP